MAYPHKWSSISYKSSAGQRKHIGQRPMLYRWTTPPTVNTGMSTACVHGCSRAVSTARHTGTMYRTAVSTGRRLVKRCLHAPVNTAREHGYNGQRSISLLHLSFLRARCTYMLLVGNDTVPMISLRIVRPGAIPLILV